MARKKRYSIVGKFYHVMLRGNDGQNIFFDDADRFRICQLIQEEIEEDLNEFRQNFADGHLLGDDEFVEIIQ